MLNEKQEIAEKIRDGSYYTDARSWYSVKYLYPVSERSMMFLFAIAAFLAFMPIAVLLNTTVQTNGKVPFPIIAADSTAHFSFIKPLAEKDETAQEAVAKYLISDYVKSREEYIYRDVTGDKLKKLLKKIKSSSAKPILNEYVNYMSENNPYSPLVRYKDHTNRFIQIKSLSFLDNDQTSGKAKVIFEATESSGGEINKSTWEIMINFRLPDVSTIARTGAPLRFIVGYYRAKVIDAGQTAKTTSVKTDAVPVADDAKVVPSEAGTQSPGANGQEGNAKQDDATQDKTEQNTNAAEKNPANEPDAAAEPNQEKQGQ